jgi:hypothetical protein
MTTATANDLRTAIPTSSPPGWDKEMPRYKVVRETLPAPKPRFKFEPPFASSSDGSVWQYGEERIYKPGEVISTRSWPHPLFIPQNYVAKRILDFFVTRQKSRLPRSPYEGDRLRLDDGLIGTMPKIVGPKVQPIGMQPAGGWPSR